MNKEIYHKLVKQRPYLWWWVPDNNRKELSTESIVQGVLANGDMDDINMLFQIVGKENVKQIFKQQISGRRHNYSNQTVNFFKKVFAQEV